MLMPSVYTRSGRNIFIGLECQMSNSHLGLRNFLNKFNIRIGYLECISVAFNYINDVISYEKENSRNILFVRSNIFLKFSNEKNKRLRQVMQNFHESTHQS